MGDVASAERSIPADPVLKVWEHAYPGTVKPKAELLADTDLVAHVRYPEDFFKVQRDVLASYHVTDPTKLAS